MPRTLRVNSSQSRRLLMKRGSHDLTRRSETIGLRRLNTVALSLITVRAWLTCSFRSQLNHAAFSTATLLTKVGRTCP